MVIAKHNPSSGLEHLLSGSSSTGHSRSTRNNGNVGFGGQGYTGVPGEKPLRARARTKDKLISHMVSPLGFKPVPYAGVR